jgi:Flp pilus assembly protein TadG
MVTVETALAVPVLALVALLAASLPALVGARIGCADAAREVALALARGEDETVVARLVTTVAPGAGVQATRVDDLVRVEVAREVPLGPWHLASVTVRGRAAAVVEP